MEASRGFRFWSFNCFGHGRRPEPGTEKDAFVLKLGRSVRRPRRLEEKESDVMMRRLSRCTCSGLGGDDRSGACGSTRERAEVVEVSSRGARSLTGRVKTMPSSRPVSALSMRTFACVVAALALGGPAQADCISQTVGTTTIHNCDGKLSTSHTVGSTTVHNIDGKIAVSQTVGKTTVHSFNGKLGTSQTVGSTTIHNIDGRFGVSQRIGDVAIHSGPLFTASDEPLGQ